MNIQSVVSAYGAKPYEPSAKSGKKAAPENTTAVLEKEQVEFSDTSLNLQKMRNLIDDIPDVRIAKVEEIKLKIKYNGYPMETNLYKAVKHMVEQRIL
ncbi:MAG: flagellar biosynthesis anti-sigma factor FlgM [Fibrobacter sp.]|nr:flagellar biosynthesis anti-sigma factor FlgM [Fibrobacter sp.]